MPRIAVAAACLTLVGLAAPGQAAADAVPGELLVRFEGGVSSAQRADARSDHDVGLKKQTRVSGLQLVKADPGQTVGEAVQDLEGDSRVAYAEPNTIVRAASTPNDPFYSTLWGLEKIKAPGAWDATTGSGSITVAVTDSGVAYDHPDLVNRMWTNSGEEPGNGDDDDDNGYEDDVRGWDTIDGDNDPRDLEEHGTHVAGTIGAQGNNSTGLTGVAQDIRIMPIRVLRPGTGGTAAALIEGFDYAGDMGADIVNASLSGEGTMQSVQDVVEDHPDTLFVAAAGNDGADLDGAGPTRWPCNVTADNLICVGATDQSDNRASFSNYGASSVDLGAPGTSVRSTVSASEELVGTRDDFESDDFLTRWDPDGTWSRTAERHAGGSWSMTDSPGGSYEDDTDAAVTTAAPYDLTGKQGCYVHYDMRLRTETNFDSLRVETSRTGFSSWTTRKQWSGVLAGGEFASYSTYLASDGRPSYVRFRLTTDGEGQNDDGAHLDNVRVVCKSSSYDESHYKYFQGTSMATPHVSGTAALVLSLRPTATVAQLRDALLETGDPSAGLDGKTVTGKRLNALGAVGHGGPLAETGAASGIGGSGAKLNATVNPVGSATTYRFEYGPTTEYGNETTVKSAGSGTTPVAVSDTVTGLRPSTSYHFRVVSSRGGVEVPGADATFTTAASLIPPAQVQGLGAQAGVRSVALNWNDTPSATGYEVFTRRDSGSYPATPAATVTASDHTVTGLTEGQRVCFRVRATNVDGPGQGSNEMCATPTGPPPGSTGTLSATAGVAAVALDWGNAPGATGYVVHRRTSPGAYPVFPLAGTGVSNYNDSRLTAGTVYCYRVQGVNPWGAGPVSAERCALPRPAPPATKPPQPPAQSVPGPLVLADLSRSRGSLRVSRRGLFVWGFRATPSVLGRVTFTSRVGRRTFRLGSKRFRANSARSVRPRIRLSRRHMRILRARKALRVRATVVLAGRKASRTFVLKSP